MRQTWAACSAVLVCLALGGLPVLAQGASGPSPSLSPPTATPAPAATLASPHPQALVPTGVEVLTPETGGYSQVVADGDGILWAREPGGRLVRFDPASGSARAWTIADDAGFGVTRSSGFDILPAREGGVWLVGQRTLRLFDGQVFRQVIDAPTDIGIAAEAPDGSLWATTGPWPGGTDGAVWRWDGSSWSSLDLDGLSADATVGALAVDEAGWPWIGWVRNDLDLGPGSPVDAGRVSRYDGSSWTTFDEDDAAALGGSVRTIAQMPDGAMWVASTRGLARFDGSSWTDPGGPCGRWGASVAAGPDGRIWVAAGDDHDGAVTVARLDGRSWVFYGPSDGLPGPNESGYVTAWALPTKDGVYVGTGAGIYGLNGDRWERAWPAQLVPMDLRDLLAVSSDELWATDVQGGLVHYQGDTWTRDAVDPRHPQGEVHALTLAPDGTVWAAGSDGVAYRRDGQWVIADAAEANVITIDRDGAVWVGSGEDGGEACRVSMLRFDGAAWVRRVVASCPPGSSGLSSLAVDANGALWAAWEGWTPGSACGFYLGCPAAGLARLDGRSWDAIRELGGSDLTRPTIVGTTRTGAMWVVDDPTAFQGPAGSERPVRAARFDGIDWMVELPEGSMADIVVAPDGTLWASTWWWWVPPSTGGGDQGPARYDGTAWTFPYDGMGLPWMQLTAVAPDGTLFGEIAGSVFRFPD